MSRTSLVTVAAVLFACLAIAGTAEAAKTTLYVHGYSPLSVVPVGNTYDDWSSWGTINKAGGVNRKAVNWGGQDFISQTNGYVRNALDCFCTGDNWCYISTHSTGDSQVGYALSQYGNTLRNVKNTSTPGPNGVCQDVPNSSGRTTQTGWNIYWVTSAGGAGGGSELAGPGQIIFNNFITHQTVLEDLVPSHMRSLYDHNQTQSHWFYRFAGSNGVFSFGALPGEDDSVVAYHSAGGLSQSGHFCNNNPRWWDPTSWNCYELKGGTEAAGNGVAKWSYQYLWFRDNAGEYYHPPVTASQDSLLSVLRSMMNAYAW